MAAPTPEELAILEHQRRAMLAGDREAWLATVDPGLVAEMLPDWPGPSRVGSAEAAWNVYHDFFAQFGRATQDLLNVETDSGFTTADVRFKLVGQGSQTPVEVSWTVVIEFDAEARRYTSHRWFHTRDEAVAWVSALPTPAGRDED
jgi:hypothetical protein